MQNNAAKIENLKWQYFGTEKGTYVEYPANNAYDCDDYDPRFR